MLFLSLLILSVSSIPLLNDYLNQTSNKYNAESSGIITLDVNTGVDQTLFITDRVLSIQGIGSPTIFEIHPTGKHNLFKTWNSTLA